MQGARARVRLGLTLRRGAAWASASRRLRERELWRWHDRGRRFAPPGPIWRPVSSGNEVQTRARRRAFGTWPCEPLAPPESGRHRSHDVQDPFHAWLTDMTSPLEPRADPWRRGLRELAELRTALDRLEAALVDRARLDGATWDELAEALAVSRPTAHRRHAAHDPIAARRRRRRQAWRDADRVPPPVEP